MSGSLFAFVVFLEMFNDLGGELLNQRGVVDIHFAVAVHIARKLLHVVRHKQLRGDHLNHRSVIDVHLAVAVDVAEHIGRLGRAAAAVDELGAVEASLSDLFGVTR